MLLGGTCERGKAGPARTGVVLFFGRFDGRNGEAVRAALEALDGERRGGHWRGRPGEDAAQRYGV